MHFDALLTDGETIRIRPVEPTDADAVAAFHARLSPATTRQRYFAVHPRLSPEELAWITDVDHVDRETLLAEHGTDGIVGIVNLVRLSTSDCAEVAVVVDDRWQGRGVGTLLLEHATTLARNVGVRRLVADTLADNVRMLDVFANAGFRIERDSDSGVVHVTVDVGSGPSDASAVERREHVSEARSVARLLQPRSVAVIGASRHPGTVGHELVRNLHDGGFTGRIYPVNPHVGLVAGVRAYPTVAAIPDEVDLAVIAVPAAAVLDVIEECGAKGVHGVVVVSAGFAEVGADGAERQHWLVAAARRHGMRVIGPNCVGIVNTDPGIRLNATFAPTAARPGVVAFGSQSGALGIAVLAAATEAGIGVSSFVSTGNKADVSGNDLLQYWEDDEATDVVLLYLESFGNPRKFVRLARRIGRRKPIVAVKSGRTAAGRRAALSHTAAMASPDTAVDALFREAGVIRVDTSREMIDTALVLANQPLPAGRRLAIVGNSGGPGIIAADCSTTADLAIAELSATTQAALRQALPAGAAVSNPVDLLAGAGPDQYATALRAALDDDGVDMVLAVFTPTLVADPAEVEAAIAAVGSASAKPLVAAAIATPTGLLAAREAGGRGVPRYGSVEEAVRALGNAARYAAWRATPLEPAADLDEVDADASRKLIAATLERSPGGAWMDADEAVSLLRSYGISAATTVRVETVDEAKAAAHLVGWPVALKLASGSTVHKTEVGGVVLDLADAAELARAYTKMEQRFGQGVDLVVQPMAPRAVETIAGIVNDSSFGPLVMFGFGGTTAELLGDRSFRLVPLGRREAAGLVRSLRGSPLLTGYRGSVPVDVDALEELLVRLARLAADHPEIAEADLNPVLATADGAVAVDAKIRVQPVRTQHEARQLAPPRPPLPEQVEALAS